MFFVGINFKVSRPHVIFLNCPFDQAGGVELASLVYINFAESLNHHPYQNFLMHYLIVSYNPNSPS